MIDYEGAIAAHLAGEPVPLIEAITQADFDHQWRKLLEQDATRWHLVRENYFVGQRIRGYVEIIQPLGVLINLGDSGVIARAMYEACKAGAATPLWGRFSRVTGIVTGYDNNFHWLELSQPAITNERIDPPYWW